MYQYGPKGFLMNELVLTRVFFGLKKQEIPFKKGQGGVCLLMIEAHETKGKQFFQAANELEMRDGKPGT